MKEGMDYSAWPESRWTSADIDWKSAKAIHAGVDIGTTSAQTAILCDGELFGYSSIRIDAGFREVAETALAGAFGDSGMSAGDLGAVVATGFGRRNVANATKTADEIHCHAKGARFIFGPEVTTVVDLGAQTCRAIRLHSWDRVRDFMLGDICATGMGRNIETVCELLHVPITEIGELSLELDGKDDPEPVSTTCFAFAETETLGLFRPEFRADPLTLNEIYASHIFAVEWRIIGVIGKLSPLDAGDVRVDGRLGLTGGLAKNVGITKRLERDLAAEALAPAQDPMLAGAIGAALLA
jgi:benzoyl-CoA reductase subunit A